MNLGEGKGSLDEVGRSAEGDGEKGSFFPPEEETRWQWGVDNASSLSWWLTERLRRGFGLQTLGLSGLHCYSARLSPMGQTPRDVGFTRTGLAWVEILGGEVGRRWLSGEQDKGGLRHTL